MYNLIQIGETKWYNEDKIDTNDPREWDFIAIREPLSITHYEYEGEDVVVIKMHPSVRPALQRMWNEDSSTSP
jgi:hypothetical protein